MERLRFFHAYEINDISFNKGLEQKNGSLDRLFYIIRIFMWELHWTMSQNSGNLPHSALSKEGKMRVGLHCCYCILIYIKKSGQPKKEKW